MAIVFYISSHGFGHATREIELINALLTRRPDLDIVVRSDIPRWLLELSAPAQVTLQPLETDTGVLQIDSLTLNEEETVRRAAAFYEDFDSRVEAEAAVLRNLRASMVVADVPPLAPAAAKRAGVPSVVVANFTWDWIYGAYASFHTAAPRVLETIRVAYAATTAALRLPMHGGFEPMLPVTEDIPLIARHGRSREATRERLGLESHRPVVLASFGGFGLSIPYDEIARRNHLTIVVTDFEARSDTPSTELCRKFDRRALHSVGIRYEDLVAASDVVVSKPGYGIVSECVANRAALLYTSRGHFAEFDVLTAEMPRLLRCRLISRDDLLHGNWSTAVEAVLEQPQPPEAVPTDGADVAAERILKM